MPQTRMHVLEREFQPVRGAGRIAPLLRREMDERGVSAKELAFEMKAWAKQDPANRWALDFRTIQNAAAGTACALDTYLALSGFFGWDFVENVLTPIRGADPLADREAEVERQLRQVAALQARVERDRELRTAAATSKHRAKGEPAGSPSFAARATRAVAVAATASPPID